MTCARIVSDLLSGFLPCELSASSLKSSEALGVIGFDKSTEFGCHDLAGDDADVVLADGLKRRIWGSSFTPADTRRFTARVTLDDCRAAGDPDAGLDAPSSFWLLATVT